MATGEEMLAQNMAAFESGQDLPYSEDYQEPDTSEPIEPEESQEHADELESADDAEYEPEEVQEEHEDVAEIAKRDGYMTAEEWEAKGNDPEDYMSQDEFAKVAELRDNKGEYSRQKLAKQLVQQEKLLKDVMAGQQKMLADAEERIRKETLEKLKAEQAEATEYGDTTKAVEIEREIIKHEQPVKEPEQPAVQPAIQQFYNENNHWFGVDQGATGLLNAELKRAEAAGLEFEEAIGPAMAKVKKHFSYHFDDDTAQPETAQPKKDAKPLVRPRSTSERSAKSAPAAKKASKTFNDLPPEQRAIAKRAAKISGMTEKEYMEQMQ